MRVMFAPNRRARRRFLFLALSFLGIVGLYLVLTPGGEITAGPYQPPSHHTDFRDGNGVRAQAGQACVHPELQLWHPDLRKYFGRAAPLDCARAEENWVYVINGTFHITSDARQRHGNILCEYLPLVRKDDFTVEYGPAVKPMESGTLLPSDFFKVRCVAADGKVYSNLHAGVSARPQVAARSTKGMSGPGVLGLNVLMFGFDSVSRMTWIRNLPKTYDYLTKTLGGVVLEGYNIVGDGTPQALLPILTGKTEPELPEARRGFKGATTVDGHPWLFRQLHRLGYVTQWGEDGAAFGTFTYRMLGFREQPVDHYMRPFYLEAEALYSYHKPYCLGTLPRHLNMLNWVRDLFMVYPKQPKFSFLFHSEYSHDANNKLQVADDDVRDFLAFMNEKGYLDNTVLVLMADHGARFQATRGTEQGKYEERMPFFSFRFPPWFEAKYPEAVRNLRTNANRLTTPFDVHATLRELVNYTGAGEGATSQRGISLLKEVPKERTCRDAGIEAHWCACLNWKRAEVTDVRVRGAAEELVRTINSMTAQQRAQCEPLRVSGILSAGRFAASDKLLKFKQSKDMHGRVPDFSDGMTVTEEMYQVTVTTSPGGGRFEATVRYEVRSDTYAANAKEISRINKYGKQPHCVMEEMPHLRPYCYCRTQLT